MSEKNNQRIIRHKRIRAKLKGTAECPRLSVYRSNAHIYAQLIDDSQQKTLIAASDQEIKKTKAQTDKKMSGKIALAYQVGLLIAQKAKDAKIERIRFDRGGYRYHGRINALADGAREGGLQF